MHSYDLLGERCISLIALLGPLKRGKALFQLGIPGVNSELLGKYEHNMAPYGMAVAFDARLVIYS